ncbi:MAG TPA: MucR family transcriptional regulator [Caulobacteraceae bacterium]
MEDGQSSLLRPTVDVVGAFLATHKLAAGDIPALIAAVSSALGGLGAPEPAAPAAIRLTPGQIRKSITPDALISFEDGKGYKTLKRHLTTRGMTVAEYKSKWGLPSNYPTTSPTYSAKRSAMAKSIGLGSGGRKAAGPARSARGGARKKGPAGPS